MLVRVEGVGPSSHPWEGYIIAVIRYPLSLLKASISAFFRSSSSD